MNEQEEIDEMLRIVNDIIRQLLTLAEPAAKTNAERLIVEQARVWLAIQAIFD